MIVAKRDSPGRRAGVVLWSLLIRVWVSLVRWWFMVVVKRVWRRVRE